MNHLDDLRERLMKKAEEENERRYRNVASVVAVAHILNKAWPETQFTANLDKVLVAFNLPKRDDKFIWLTAEEIFDLFGIGLNDSWHSQSSSYFSIMAGFDDITIDLTFYFAESCTPIRKEVTEVRTVGYRCG